MYYASLDHALWFHRDFKIDDWLLYAIESPSASNARGYARGSIFDQSGTMVASVSQEGLMTNLNTINMMFKYFKTNCTYFFS